MSLISGVFSSIVNFFDSVAGFISYDILFFSFIGLQIILMIVLGIMTKNSFEIRMVKSIDSINKFLEKNPKVSDDCLVAFNDKMKRVPATMRTQWQQFMLYREHPCGYYMSFKNCVETPIKTSSYKQNMSLIACLNFIALSFAVIFGIFSGFDWTNISMFFKNVLLIPVLMLTIYLLVIMFINARMNAITSDLFQNYQFFMKNLDRATSTLPDYVDYEVLFSKREIKQGIPVLFEYLERRAQIEQEELERARQKNIEHEKYNFEKAGLESSLVLERAMGEAERYLSERKKFMSDIERSDNEIGSLQLRHREYEKEYQRKMQAGKENLERLKNQLDQSASNIEANYIRKQRDDEVTRQQNLEKEYDNITDKYKKDVTILQKDIAVKREEIDSLRGKLELQMMSEFDSYSKKVYDLVQDLVDKKQIKKFSTIDQARIDAEERLAQKERDLEKLYVQYQVQTERLDKRSYEHSMTLREKERIIQELQSQLALPADKKSKSVKSNTVSPIVEEPIFTEIELIDDGFVMSPAEQTKQSIKDMSLDVKDTLDDITLENNLDAEHTAPIGTDLVIDAQGTAFTYIAPIDKDFGGSTSTTIDPEIVAVKAQPVVKSTRGRPKNAVDPIIVEEPKRGRGRPSKTTIEETPVVKGTRGRPRKVVTETISEAPKRGRGRPKKNNAIDLQIKELNDRIYQESQNLRSARQQLDNELKDGLESELQIEKRKAQNDKQQLLDNILNNLSIISESTQEVISDIDSESNLLEIEYSIKDMNKSLDKLRKK